MVELRKITWDNWEECIKLKVSENQDDFIASNLYSLAESYVGMSNDKFPPMNFAIYSNDMIGFTLLYYDAIDEDQCNHDKPYYGIARFMIDERYQQKGFGRQYQKYLPFLRLVRWKKHPQSFYPIILEMMLHVNYINPLDFVKLV